MGDDQQHLSGGQANGLGTPSTGRAHATLALLMLVAVFAYSNVQLFALLATDIKKSFGLSDASIGILQGFTVNFSTVVALIPVGMLVDRVNRIRLLMAASALWGIFTLLTGLSETFWQLFACRVGVGIAEAAIYPASYSLIADLYSPKRRAIAVPVFLTGTLAGASLVTALTGVLIGSIATTVAGGGGLWDLSAWRLAFLAAAVPGFVLAIILIAAREPVRHEDDGSIDNADAISFVAFVKRERRLLGRLIGAIVLSQLGLAPIFGWLPTLYTRLFGYTAGEAGQLFGGLFGIGSLSGVAIGTLLVSRLGKRDASAAPLTVLKIGVALAAVASLVLPFAHTPFAISAAVAVLIAAIYIGMTVTPTLLMLVAPNHLRGRLVALETLSLISTMAVTPPLVGLLSDTMFKGPNGLLLGTCAVIIPAALLAPILLAGVRRVSAPAG
jgi:MFS family permease